MQEYARTFSVRLNERQYQELKYLLNEQSITPGQTSSDRFRKLLSTLERQRSGGGAHTMRLAEVASTTDSCDFSEVMTGHREWLEQHFPGELELQLKVCLLLIQYDPNTSYDWEAARDELKSQIQAKVQPGKC
jgi:hypothetical protein